MGSGTLTMLVMGGIGGLSAAIGFFWGVSAVMFSMRATRTRGVIAGARARSSGGVSVQYAPVVRFQTAQGQSVEFTSNVATGGAPQVGAPIDVLYLPSNPQAAKLPGFRMWVGPVSFFLTGGFLAFVGVIVGVAMPG